MANEPAGVISSKPAGIPLILLPSCFFLTQNCLLNCRPALSFPQASLCQRRCWQAPFPQLPLPVQVGGHLYAPRIWKALGQLQGAFSLLLRLLWFLRPHGLPRHLPWRTILHTAFHSGNHLNGSSLSYTVNILFGHKFPIP